MDSGDYEQPKRETEAEASRARRRLRGRVNQVERAVVAVHLSVDALSKVDKLLVLNACLRDALEDAR